MFGAAEGQHFRALQRFAQNLGSKKPLQINELGDCERAMTGKIGPSASIGAVVEFSTRAIAGPAHD